MCKVGARNGAGWLGQIWCVQVVSKAKALMRGQRASLAVGYRLSANKTKTLSLPTSR